MGFVDRWTNGSRICACVGIKSNLGSKLASSNPALVRFHLLCDNQRQGLVWQARDGKFMLDCVAGTNFVEFTTSLTVVSQYCTFDPLYLSMRDSATSAMRRWEQQKPDGFALELFLDQLILLESWI
jgi:hypothetical protein